MKITNAELIGEMKHYAISAEIDKGKTILLINATLTEMYDANSDSTAYELTNLDSDSPVSSSASLQEELKEKAIEWIEAKKCSVCGMPEDEDGRCGCTNADVNA